MNDGKLQETQEFRKLPRKPVSDVSRFGDNEWELDRSNKSKSRSNRIINWDASLGKHGRLTDPKHAELLNRCKLLIYSIRNGKAAHGHIKGSSLVCLGVNLISFVRWMVLAGFYRFSSLNGNDVLQYRSFVANNPGRWNNKLDKYDSPKTAAPLHPKSVQIRMQPIVYLVELRALIGDAPKWDPLLEPGDYLGTAASKKPIPRIPDEIAEPLYREALTWVTEYADPLIKLKRRMRDIFFSEQKRWKNRDYKYRAARRILNASDIQIRTATGSIKVAEIDAFEFRKLLLYLNAACYVIVAGFTGMRISEISDLETTCLSAKTIAGMRVLILEGGTIKTAPGEYESASWVAGIDGDDNPVKIAIGVLRRLWAQERKAAGKTNLFVARGHDGWENVNDLTGSAANWRLNEFLQIIPTPYSWRLSTHQFRKTFARFVATADSLALFALKRHFKHVSIQMTDMYIGNDSELFELVAKAQEEHARDLLDTIIGGSRLAGKLGEEILRGNKCFRGLAGADVRKAYVDALMNNSDVLVKPNPYGLCIFRRDFAACGGDISRVGIDTCSGCRNNVIGPAHRQYWEERIIQLDDYCAALPKKWLTRDRKDSIEQSLAEAKEIVNTLKGRRNASS